jgi:hypothetical protein
MAGRKVNANTIVLKEPVRIGLASLLMDIFMPKTALSETCAFATSKESECNDLANCLSIY